MAVQLVTIEVLGASFAVQTDETREYMETLLAELERRLDSLRTATRVSDPLKLSILANITMLDELARLRRQAGENQASDELGRLAERLIGRLDEELGATEAAKTDAAENEARTEAQTGADGGAAV
ncbi:MAG: cell division protein ZapA [Spirochaetaceae bacterium]|nr:cell division protein ZapA [Spirochaetaceae bacterium]